MKVINAMFGKGQGGIEQAFLDYNHALTCQNIQVFPFIHPKAKVKKHIAIPLYKVSNFSKFDPFAILKLRKLISQLEPNYIIAHGNRAISLCAAASKVTPVIAVCHNSKIKYDTRIKHIFAVAHHLVQNLIDEGYKKSQITVIPNMVHLTDEMRFNSVTPNSEVLKIGTIARLSEEKRIDDLIRAVAEIKHRGVKVEAYIAGEGKEAGSLTALTRELGVQNEVTFMGWIDNKLDFFNKIDVFCLTSRIESFGIVLLEAMSYSKYIVATDTTGAHEVLEGGAFGLLAKIGDPESIANAILELHSDYKRFDKMREAAFLNLHKYSMLNVARTLKRTLEELSYKDIIQS